MSFDLEIDAPEHVVNYYKKLTKQVNDQLAVAKKARAKGKDVSLEVETTPTTDLADRCEKITGPPGVAKRYREIYEEMDGNRTKSIFKIFKEIIENDSWVNIDDREKRLEQAVKTSLVLVTEGVVVAPLDGVPSVKISKNFDGSKFVDIYFAGPIRAAGGTATVFPLILGDYARKLMGLEKYKPTEEEIERYVEETNIYDDIFTRQYKLHPDEVRKIIRGCPVCINGEPTEEREVTAYKDLERIPSNRVRGGMCLVICEGVALKAMKILTFAKMLELDWKWLEAIIKVNKGGETEKTIKENFSYLTRIAAGRPIFSYPMKPGGFRLRYGRSRNTGIMGKAIHPATMYVLDEFLAVGTQIKVERPGKSAEIFPCDSVDGPIVKLLNDEVRKISSVKEAQEIKHQLKEIIFLGDLLISYGDFRKSAHPLMPVGYCVEWWVLELEKALKKGEKVEGIDTAEILKNPENIDGFTAAELSLQLKIPLHPDYIHYYPLLKHKDVVELVDAVRKGKKIFDGNRIIALEMENFEEIKELLETIGLPHKINEEKIIIGENLAYSFVKTFGGLSLGKVPEEGSILEILSKLSGMEIKDKCGTFIGTRMGRPEAARPRKMVGNPHVLFPIGLYGGTTRSINKASDTSELKGGKRGEIEVEMAFYKCPECGKTVPLANCPECGARATKVYLCGRCGNLSETKKCSKCSAEADAFSKRKVNVDDLLSKALSSLRVKMPETLKGVKGLINANKISEPIEKGILRANRNLNIFRDATIRYEMLNAPLTHFKPREIGTSAAKLKEMGYENDVDGKPLENDEQLLEIFPQDIIINEDSVDFFLRVTKFVDDLLTKFYGLEAYFKKSTNADLIGELALGLAPHTSAAIVGRIIGFSKARLCFAHPFFHLCKRRNADGDQDSVMLLMDGLLNFSQHYLPSTRGGRMDAPLVFTVALKPTEIDDEAYEIETCTRYPLELYEKCSELIPPDLDSIPRVFNKLGTKEQYTGVNFTHPTSTFDAGPKVSRYVQLDSMESKINAQAKLQNKIRAVEKKDALERVMVSHFLPDIIGNARAFSRQTFRCTKCNTKYRRIPLSGKCMKCGDSGNIILTIAQGSVRKYLKIANEMILKYGLSDYLKQRIKLIEREVDSVFQNDKMEQKNLLQFV